MTWGRCDSDALYGGFVKPVTEYTERSVQERKAAEEEARLAEEARPAQEEAARLAEEEHMAQAAAPEKMPAQEAETRNSRRSMPLLCAAVLLLCCAVYWVMRRWRKTHRH